MLCKLAVRLEAMETAGKRCTMDSKGKGRIWRKFYVLFNHNAKLRSSGDPLLAGLVAGDQFFGSNAEEIEALKQSFKNKQCWIPLRNVRPISDLRRG